MFEGSYLGDPARIADDARLECGICWWVYDPAEGDPVAQVAPGTPFSRLPAYWACPNCDAPRHKFMVVSEPDRETGAAAPSSATPPGAAGEEPGGGPRAQPEDPTRGTTTARAFVPRS